MVASFPSCPTTLTSFELWQDCYDDASGLQRVAASGAYRGRPEDTDRNAGIAGMLRSGMSWTDIQAATGCSRATIAKVAKRAA